MKCSYIFFFTFKIHRAVFWPASRMFDTPVIMPPTLLPNLIVKLAFFCCLSRTELMK